MQNILYMIILYNLHNILGSRYHYSNCIRNRGNVAPWCLPQAVFLHGLYRKRKQSKPTKNISAQAHCLVCTVSGGIRGKKQTDIPCPRLPDQGAMEPKSEPRQSGLKNTVLCCLFVDYSCSNITKFQGQLHVQVFCTVVLCTNSRFLHDVLCFEGLENIIAMGTMEKGAR